MPGDDLKQYASSSEDFYALLGVNFETSESDIQRAWRKTSLKFHPDKNPGNLAAVEKFHQLGIARDVLLDPEAKAAYDKVRAARIQKQRQDELFEGKRRKLKEDLERREGGFKRKRDEEAEAQERFEMELRRLEEDGKRRRREREEMLSRDQNAQEEIEKPSETPTSEPISQAQQQPQQQQETLGSEIDRTVKVRWVRGDPRAPLKLDKQGLSAIFSRFGRVDSAFLLKDKKVRLSSEKHKKIMATGVLVFTSAVSAHSAIDEGKAAFDFVESVSWASDQRQPKAEQTTPLLNSVSSSPSFSFRPSSGSPSLEESTLLRLKAAERRKMEEKIRMEEEAAAAAEELGNG